MVVPTFTKYPRKSIVKTMLHHADDIPAGLITPTDASAFERFWEHKRALRGPLSTPRFKGSWSLGHGGGGAVVRARLRKTTTVYAVKAVVFKGPDERYDPRESNIARYITTCRVPFTSVLLGAFVEDGMECMISEIAYHGDLYAILKAENGASAKDTLRWAVELTAALTTLHGHGIIHRDLKPSNILIDAERHVRLTDWGMAYWAKRDDPCYWDARKRIPTVYPLLGTKGYNAPEMLTTGRYGASIDWWAFGVVLYEVIVGKHPFINDQGEVRTQYVLRRQIEIPSTANRKYGDSAVSLVRSLLVRDPSLRLVDDSIKHAAYFFGVAWEQLQGPFCDTDAVLKFPYTLLPGRDEALSDTPRIQAGWWQPMSGSSVATTASRTSTNSTSSYDAFSDSSSISCGGTEFDDAVDYADDFDSDSEGDLANSLVMPVIEIGGGGGSSETAVATPTNLSSSSSSSSKFDSEPQRLSDCLPAPEYRRRVPALMRTFAILLGF
ncbi:kinase-like protein [Auricularia subglabra TFB-10046 SS5]|nr:kinase-like protein [Auricularia subglabra TFB-10046 SS5]